MVVAFLAAVRIHIDRCRRPRVPKQGGLLVLRERLGGVGKRDEIRQQMDPKRHQEGGLSLGIVGQAVTYAADGFKRTVARRLCEEPRRHERRRGANRSGGVCRRIQCARCIGRETLPRRHESVNQWLVDFSLSEIVWN